MLVFVTRDHCPSESNGNVYDKIRNEIRASSGLISNRTRIHPAWEGHSASIRSKVCRWEQSVVGSTPVGNSVFVVMVYAHYGLPGGFQSDPS